MAKIPDKKLEAAARAIMKFEGFETSEISLISTAQAGNPRCEMWVSKARVALEAVAKA